MDAGVSAAEGNMKQITVRWLDRDLPIPLVNVFAFQLTPDGIVTSLGAGRPPLLSGSPAQQLEMLENLEEIEVVPTYRFVMPVIRAQELLGSLLTVLTEAGVIRTDLDQVAPS